MRGGDPMIRKLLLLIHRLMAVPPAAVMILPDDVLIIDRPSDC